MNDFAMQNDCWADVNVRELPVMRLRHRHHPVPNGDQFGSVASIPQLHHLRGSWRFAHAVKVDVRLVSFPLSGVRNDLAPNQRSAA